MKSSPSIWRYVVNVKSAVKILSIFVAFLENMNFKNKAILQNGKSIFSKYVRNQNWLLWISSFLYTKNLFLTYLRQAL